LLLGIGIFDRKVLIWFDSNLIFVA